MLLIFIFAHFLARFLALAHTRVFLLTQRFLLSYILMKIFLFVDLRLQWLPRLSLASALVRSGRSSPSFLLRLLFLASALALLSIVIRFPSRLPWREADALRGSACCIRSSRLLWSFRLPSDCLDVSLGAKRTLFAAPLSFWPKTKNSVFDLKQLRFFTAKTCAPLFRSSLNASYQG